ncbi:hypothetical protein Dimus_010594 [Dionaea muscipula]
MAYKKFDKILIGNKLRKMQKFRGKNKLKKKLKFRGNQKIKGLQWNIQDHGVDPSGHLPDYELIHLQTEFARALQVNFRFQESF